MFFRNCCKFKKIIAACILGMGVGMFLILIFSPILWLYIISISLIVIGIKKIFER